MNFLRDRASVDLNGAWQLAYGDAPHENLCSSEELTAAGLETIPATVPGNFELDLQRAGLLDEPFFADNVLQLRKLERKYIWLWRKFKASDREGHESRLFFGGIDCFAKIYLNGELIGETDNMLVEHTFDVTGKLRDENELLICIRPALDEARKFEYPPRISAAPSNMQALHIRKAPHMFGWDIAPRAVSAGLWRDVKLVYCPKEGWEWAWLETLDISHEEQWGRMRLSYRVHLPDLTKADYSMKLEGVCGESEFSIEKPVFFEATYVKVRCWDAKFWWPAGRGEPNLYDITLTLYKNGEVIDTLKFKHGIRTATLERTSLTDEDGSGEFVFYVNGEKTFARGTNWVPLDPFHSRDLERLDAAVDMMADLNCNMVRCWGGNVYESDRFYELCDERGIMVWQDFSMACMIYPQNEDFQRRLAEEAKKVVRRLRQHVCIVLWAGDNEVDQSIKWITRPFNPEDNLLTRKVLPEVLCEEDTSRPYLPSSPYVDADATPLMGLRTPEDHPWDMPNPYKEGHSGTCICHFASEIGYYGCPVPETMRAFLPPEKLWPPGGNDLWALHSTDAVPGVTAIGSNRIEFMAKNITDMFGSMPDNLEDYAVASQCVQAEAKKFFIERFRGEKWRRTGVLWWNLLDSWLQLSPAVIDYFLRPKLAYTFIRNSQQPLCLMFREADGGKHSLVASNDTGEAVDLTYTVRDVDTGEIVAEGSGRAEINATTPLATVEADDSQQRFYVIEWQAGKLSGKNHYLAGQRPFDLDRYRGWLRKAGLLDEPYYQWIK